MLMVLPPTATREFQKTYPDQHNLRVQYIEATIRFEKYQKAHIVVSRVARFAMLTAYIELPSCGG